MKLKIRDQEIEIPDSDTWIHQQSGRRVITHAGVQRIAEEFKLQILEPKLLIAPSQDNNGLVVIQVAIKEGDRVTWEIHEASDDNTTSVSRSYKVRMAFKRAYDKAILSHLSLYNVASDIESEDFRKRSVSKPQRKRKVAKSNGTGNAKVADEDGNGGTSESETEINPKIIAKIEEISERLEVETRSDFSDNEEATAYLNELLGQFRKVVNRG